MFRITLGRRSVSHFPFTLMKGHVNVFVWLYSLGVCKVFDFLLRTTDDDSTTEKKVTLLLEKVNQVKWKTAENMEEEQKMCLVIIMF